jgi:hypothetical protein
MTALSRLMTPPRTPEPVHAQARLAAHQFTFDV